MKTMRLLVSLLAISMFLSSCGKKKEEQTEQEKAMELVDKIKEEAENMSNEEPKEVVDAKLLKEFLPNDAAGLARKSAESEKVGAMGFMVSKAEANYKNDNGDSSIEIDIIDVAGTGALMGMAAWSMMDMDKENENGYEKTTTYKGNKAYEKYNSKNKDGEMAVIVAKRFVVTVRGNNVEMDKVKDTLDDIDLGKLEDLK